jgi:hypothetical protein
MKLYKDSRKWQLGFYLGRDYRMMETGWKVFDLMLIKLKETPPEGAAVTKGFYINNAGYTKFQIAFKFWLPIDWY